MSLNISISKKFQDAFQKRCFQLIIRAYQVSLNEKVIQLNWNENDISSELHRHIDIDPLRAKWRISTNVESHIPKEDIPKTKGFADKYPRIDIRLTSFMSTFEYRYFFEAKNLKSTDSKLKGRYIDTGVDNFVSRKYVNGSLLGYLLDGKPRDVTNGINSLLKRRKRESETLILKTNPLLNNYYESNHPQIGILKHLIFDYTALAN